MRRGPCDRHKPLLIFKCNDNTRNHVLTVRSILWLIVLIIHKPGHQPFCDQLRSDLGATTDSLLSQWRRRVAWIKRDSELLAVITWTFPSFIACSRRLLGQPGTPSAWFTDRKLSHQEMRQPSSSCTQTGSAVQETLNVECRLGIRQVMRSNRILVWKNRKTAITHAQCRSEKLFGLLRKQKQSVVVSDFD